MFRLRVENAFISLYYKLTFLFFFPFSPLVLSLNLLFSFVVVFTALLYILTGYQFGRNKKIVLRINILKQAVDLTSGSIFKKLLFLALPIMGTSFVQMAYNLTDQMWLGHVGPDAVASAGTAGFLVWFGATLVHCAKVGAEFGVSHSFGRKNMNDCKNYMKHSILMAIFLIVLYKFFVLIFAPFLMKIFDMDSPYIIKNSVIYLRTAITFFMFTGLNQVFSGIYNGVGNTKRSFYISTAGLILNLVLDPIFINGWLGFPRMEVFGAALATGLSQLLVFVLYVRALKEKGSLLRGVKIFSDIRRSYFEGIIKVGGPAFLQNALLCVFAMILMRITSRFGDLAVSVQGVGVQIESLSWMTCLGFSSALAAFTGQNFGAGDWGRIKKGFIITQFTAIGIGIMSTLLFVFGGEFLFSLFFRSTETDAIRLGSEYLFILGISQIFMCIDIVSSGAFQGIGKTVPPTISNGVFFGLRIPLALALNATFIIGVHSVWWSMAGTSIVKGLLLTSWFAIVLSKSLKRYRAEQL